MGPITHVVGARPNFMKAAPVIKALQGAGVEQCVIHTGQHYDDAMSDVFFRELALPVPDRNLGVGSGSHAEQTAALLIRLEDALSDVEPACVVVYGDVNSTLAGALVATKAGIPLAHVEAGLRSFDWSMPEEVNRRVTDTLADWLFTTSPEAVAHLANEGCDVNRIFFVGNPMIDTLLRNMDRFDSANAQRRLGLDGDYGVVTMHRPGNVDDSGVVSQVVEALQDVSEALPLVVPLHPRGRPALMAAGLRPSERLRVIEPLGYIDFISLVRGAKLVLTDSGGIQEETTVLNVPCLTVRPNTERPITISHGTNRLVVPAEIPKRAREILAGEAAFPAERPPLWDGQAGERIATILEQGTLSGVRRR